MTIIRSTFLFILLCVAVFGVSQTPYVQAMIGRATGAGAAHTAGHPMKQAAPVTSGLINWYKLESDGTDSSGNGNTATNTGTGTFVPARLDNGFKFNASSTKLAIATPGVDTTSGHKNTISFWMKWDGSYVGGFSAVFSTDGGGYNLIFLNGTNCFGINTLNGDCYGVSTSGLANTWEHVDLVMNNANVTLSSLYLNGVLQTMTQMVGTPLTPSVTTTAVFGKIDTISNYWFGGIIDDVRYYSRGLTANEVSLLNKTPVSPNCDQSCVNWWQLDDNTGTSAVDSVNGTTGTLTGSPTWTSGQFGSGVAFNNIASNTQYISYGTNVSSFKFAKGNFTITAWINPSSSSVAGGSPAIFGVGAATSVSRYDIGVNPSTCNGVSGTVNKLMLFVKDDSANSYTVCSTASLNLDTWNHIAMVVNRNGQIMYGYINGTPVISQTLSALTDNISPQGTAYTANIVNGPIPYYTGSVDDIRIYSRVLSDSEIYDQYMAGIPGN